MLPTNPNNDYDAAVNHAVWFDFSACGKVEISGPEACAFLHNLATQDVKNLPLHASCEAFLTTNKARVVAHVSISRVKDDLLLLDFAPGLAEKMLAHLNHFLISEQAEIVDRSADYAMFRIVGPASSAILDGGDLKLDRLQMRGEAGFIRRHNLLNLDGFDWICPIANVETVRARLAGFAPGTLTSYETLRIEAGFPALGAEYDDQRFAMEIDRTRQAICYTKGCFLGQETIVMARDRGQLNRVLRGLVTREKSVPAVGAKVLKGSEEVGAVTSAVYSPRRGCAIALAYLRRGSWDPGTDVTINGNPAVVSALPFSLPELAGA